MRRSARLWWALCVAFCLSISPAGATTEEQEERAFSLYQAAAEDFKVRAFSKAVDKLTVAYALFPKAIILIKLAEGLEHLGRIEAAQAAFAQVEPEDEEMILRVQASMRRLSVQLARPVSVSILTGGVGDVRLIVDGLDIGRTAPTVLELSRGTHVLQLIKPGYEVHTVDPLEVKGVATVVVDVALVRERHLVRVDLGGQSAEAVVATLDGAPVELSAQGDDGVVTFRAEEGSYEFSCGGASQELVVGATEGLVVTCSAGDHSALGWGLLTGGIAAFTAGALLVGWHLIEVDYAARNNRKMEPGFPHREIIGPILMGVGVTTGILSLLVLSGDDESGGVSALAPSWTPTQGGALWGISGRF